MRAAHTIDKRHLVRTRGADPDHVVRQTLVRGGRAGLLVVPRDAVFGAPAQGVRVCAVGGHFFGYGGECRRDWEGWRWLVSRCLLYRIGVLKDGSWMGGFECVADKVLRVSVVRGHSGGSFITFCGEWRLVVGKSFAGLNDSRALHFLSD